MRRTPLAWHLTFHRKARTAAAMAGVCVAICLMFLQLGFYRAAFESAVKVFTQFDYDVVIVSSRYVVLRQSATIARARIQQARAVPGVAQAVPMNAAVAQTQFLADGVNREMLVVGVDPGEHLFGDARTADAVRTLTVRDTAIADTKRGPGYEGLHAGAELEIDGHRVLVTGEFEHGTGFAANAGVVVGDRTYEAIFGVPRGTATLGLVKVAAGADAAEVAARLRATLPRDVAILTRDEQWHGEQHFSLDVKPVGIMFTSGLALAFVVGAVILYQILCTEVVTHLREYATLRAIGYSDASVKRVVWEQAALLALVGFVPASALSYVIYLVIDATTTLPTRMTPEKIGVVLAMSLAMCVISASLALAKVERADPADLF